MPKIGRPTVMTEQVLKDLRMIFLIGATQEEACRYSGISVKTLHNHIKREPDFIQEIAKWQDEPVLKAKRKVVDDIESDTNTAKWYLERRAKEFKPKQDITTNDKDLPTPILNGIEAVNIKELNVSANYSSQEVIESNQEG